MLGLIAAAQTACTGSSLKEGDDTGQETSRTSSAETGDGRSGGAATGSGGEPGDDAAGGTTNGSGGQVQFGGADGEGEATGPTMGILSSKIVVDLSLEEFTAMCDEVDGVVEVHPSCGGRNTGPGFSYDSDTDVLTEHTCAGANTCNGFSCVVPE